MFYQVLGTAKPWPSQKFNFLFLWKQKLLIHSKSNHAFLLLIHFFGTFLKFSLAGFFENFGEKSESSASKMSLLNVLMQLRKCTAHPYLFEGNFQFLNSFSACLGLRLAWQALCQVWNRSRLSKVTILSLRAASFQFWMVCLGFSTRKVIVFWYFRKWLASLILFRITCHIKVCLLLHETII